MNPRQVKIQNIIALNPDVGEVYRSQAYGEADTVSRLLSHIQSLAEVTVKKHDQALDEANDYELITRLVLNEFSLYPHEGPLSVGDYKRFIEGLAVIAKTLPPNIHLVLTTFPVLWEDGLQHNVGLHVQSPRKAGGEPKLHHFDKRTPHKNDFCYTSKEGKPYPLYTIAQGDYYEHETFSPDVVLADTAVTTKKTNQSHGAIKIKTAQGFQFIVAIEICYEHSFSTGIYDTRKLILNMLDAPEFGTHVLTSYTKEKHKNRLIGSSVHADHECFKRKGTTFIPFDPQFGGKLYLYAYPPKPVKKLKEENLRKGVESSPLFLETHAAAEELKVNADSIRATVQIPEFTNSEGEETVEKQDSSSEFALNKNFDFGSKFFLYGAITNTDSVLQNQFSPTRNDRQFSYDKSSLQFNILNANKDFALDESFDNVDTAAKVKPSSRLSSLKIKQSTHGLFVTQSAKSADENLGEILSLGCISTP